MKVNPHWPGKPGVNDLAPWYAVLWRVTFAPFLVAGLIGFFLLMSGVGAALRVSCARKGHNWQITWHADRTEAVCRRCACVRTIWYPARPRGKGGRDV